MGIYDKDLITGKTKYQMAVDRIKYYCTGNKTLVAFSGGKEEEE